MHEIQSKSYENVTKMNSKITPNPSKVDFETDSLSGFTFYTENDQKWLQNETSFFYLFSLFNAFGENWIPSVFLFSLFGDFGDKWHRISHMDPEIYEKSQELLNFLWKY